MNKLMNTCIFIFILLVTACAGNAARGNGQTPNDATASPVVITPEVSGSVSSGPVSGSIGAGSTPATGSEQPIELGNQAKAEVTLEDNGKSFFMLAGSSFLMKLGDQYDWEIVSNDQTILDRVKNIAVVRGAQGVYQGVKAGTVTLQAAGDPVCRNATPPCGMPSIQFKITIVVK